MKADFTTYMGVTSRPDMKRVKMVFSWIIFHLLTIASLGCNIDATSTRPTADLKTLPWKLVLNHHAVTTLINTPVQLSYKVVNVYGDELHGMPPATISTSDTSVRVDENLRVISASPNALRYVYVTVVPESKKWRVADTLRIAFDTSRPDFVDARIIMLTDTVLPVNKSPAFPVGLITATGDTVKTGASIRAMLAYYQYSKPYLDPGNFWTASANPKVVTDYVVSVESHIYGKTYYDTVNLRSLMPDSVTVLIQRLSARLNPSPSAIGQADFTIVQGGKVNFRTANTTVETDIRFDNLDDVIAGNIPVVPNITGHIVTFPKVGQFTYRSKAMGDSFIGKITVVER